MRKELKTERITIRCTQSQKEKIISEAAKYDMPTTTYCCDKLFNGKARVFYAKRIVCGSIVYIGRYIDELLSLIENEESDYISKQLIMQPINNAREEISKIWKY